MFVTLIDVVESANNITETDRVELIDFINSRIAQLDKKANTPSKKDIEKQELDNRIAELAIETLIKLDKPVKCSEIIKANVELSAFSTQKLTPILTKLVADGKIAKTTVKRDTVYNIV